MVNKLEYETLDSTNNAAGELLRDEVCHDLLPLVIVAKRQTAGRGRENRHWWTGTDALAFSLLIDLEKTAIPRDRLTVITGLSGSGKSSLAFDTIYAEGQRRYMETLSAYARQFIGGMERPDVEKITGLSPVISIEQKTTNKNPRSTVGTVTEINDFLRLLYARASVASERFCSAILPGRG